ncbi:hypothetical protein EAG_08667 [Camponotus floridanus]|uniref:Uncharacterized protein n=1 Tax=Camponotus floridanus TaxID=104421 RepID=E1ZVG9_CAMFO|nr:hypothetical protein EAG_08667 [Camponotus floridanus]
MQTCRLRGYVSTTVGIKPASAPRKLYIPGCGRETIAYRIVCQDFEIHWGALRKPPSKTDSIFVTLERSKMQHLENFPIPADNGRRNTESKVQKYRGFEFKFRALGLTRKMTTRGKKPIDTILGIKSTPTRRRAGVSYRVTRIGEGWTNVILPEGTGRRNRIAAGKQGSTQQCSPTGTVSCGEHPPPAYSSLTYYHGESHELRNALPRFISACKFCTAFLYSASCPPATRDRRAKEVGSALTTWQTADSAEKASAKRMN